MQYPNETANQHYVSQIEQRLNSLNPNAALHNQMLKPLDAKFELERWKQESKSSAE